MYHKTSPSVPTINAITPLVYYKFAYANIIMTAVMRFDNCGENLMSSMFVLRNYARCQRVDFHLLYNFCNNINRILQYTYFTLLRSLIILL